MTTTTPPAKRNTRQSSRFRLYKDLECKDEFRKLRMAGFLRELHKAATEETTENVRKSIDKSVSMIKGETTGTISFDGVNLDEMTDAQANSIVETLFNGERIQAESLIRLTKAATKVLGQEETLVDLRKNLENRESKCVTVVGDLHGSLKCLHCVLDLVGLGSVAPATRNIVVFNGDYVDRGDHSLEVLSILLILKLCYPESVYLLRGNHEDTMTASIYGFREELGEKYDANTAEKVWNEFGLVFAAFPIVARTNTAVIMHGGIPNSTFKLDDIAQIQPDVRCQMKTVVNPYYEDEQLIQDIMWSDPTEFQGIYSSHRGGGCVFGTDIANDFLERHGLKYIIRAHEPFEDGFDYLDVDDGYGVITVFSTSNYPNGEGTNKGAVLHLQDDEKTYKTTTFISRELDDGVDASHSILREFVEENRRKLAKAFADTQNSDGHITKAQWSQIMANELKLPESQWMELQPELAPTTEPDSDAIKWRTFLQNYTSKIPNEELLQDNQLSLLHEHKDKFLNVFQLLDIDGSGTISKSEFVEGIKSLNEKISTAQPKLENPDDLFDVFDADKNGEISIEEFCNGLKISAFTKVIEDAFSAHEVESLQEIHEMLLVAFKYLDTDRSGAIDRVEFKRGVDLVNNRLPGRKICKRPEDLFNSLDTDKNGTIDINEFHCITRSL